MKCPIRITLDILGISGYFGAAETDHGQQNGYPLDMTFPVGESSIYYYAPFIWSNGGDLISEDGLTADGYFNSDKNAEVFQYFRGLVENKYMSATPIENLFESGRQRSSLTVHGKSTRSIRATATSTLALHRILSVITGTAADIRRLVPGHMLPLQKTEHIEAATELVKWMSGVDSGVLLYEKTKSMPSTYAAYDQITTFEEDENYKALYEQLRDYGHPRPKTPVYPQVSTSFQQVLEDVGLSGKNATNEMDKSVERINAKLKRYTR